MRPAQVEEAVYQAVLAGELEIDAQGRVWRAAFRRWDFQRGAVVLLPCERRRAEYFQGVYLQVRLHQDRRRRTAMAQRLVWRHFYGPIPDGMTVNHIDGNPLNNRPENLELATYSEQVVHSFYTLGHGRYRNAQGQFQSRGEA